MKPGTAAPLIAPHSPDVEISLLGAILQDGPAAELALRELRPLDFFDDRHRQIFSTFASLSAGGTYPDELVLIRELVKQGKDAAAGGSAYVYSLRDLVPSAGNIAKHVEILRLEGRQRLIIEQGKRLVECVAANGDDPEDHLRDFLEMVGTPHAGRSVEPFEALPATEFLSASFAGAERIVESIGLTATGVGLLSAPSGTGKSVLGLNLGPAWAGVPLPIGEALPAARPLRVLMFQV
ncbi:MAG: DnaB-like helicase N-terminal domain-containing protein, partial [candidate division NC10 bacterium]